MFEGTGVIGRSESMIKTYYVHASNCQRILKGLFKRQEIGNCCCLFLSRASLKLTM